jgi:hypothetical protein
VQAGGAEFRRALVWCFRLYAHWRPCHALYTGRQHFCSNPRRPPPAPARRRTARPKVLARGGIYLAGGMKSWKDLMAVISSKGAALTAAGKA